MKEIISLTPFLSNPVDIYIPHRSFLHPRNPALCVSVTHIPIDYLSTIALHHRGALYVRLLIRIRQHEIEGEGVEGDDRDDRSTCPDAFPRTHLRFCDSVISHRFYRQIVNTDPSRAPPSIVLPFLPCLQACETLSLPCEGESDRECIGSLPPTIGRARSCYIDRLDFIPPPSRSNYPE